MHCMRRGRPILLLFMTLLFLLPNTLLYSSFKSIRNQPATGNENLAGHIVHGPISIDGDDEFDSQAASESWPGDGTSDDPYYIENYYIDASTGHGIFIANTEVYFVIHNCTIFGGSSTYHGISLDDVSNGLIIDNEIFINDAGISVDDSSSNSIENNSVSQCEIGIAIQSSDYMIIHNNTCYDNTQQDISVIYYNKWNTITNNTCKSTGIPNIYLRETANATFSYNSMNGCGLNVLSSINWWINFVEFNDNTINGSQILILQDQVGGDYSGTYAQILLIRCDSVTVRDMVFTGLYQGVVLLYCNDTIVKNITCVGCYYGFDIIAGCRVTVTDCNASYCSYTGLMIRWGYPEEDTNDHLITNSTFHNNAYGGAKIGGEGGTTIYNNTLYDNAWGHYEQYDLIVNAQRDVTIINNTCWGSYDGNINCAAKNSLIANNTCINGWGFGIGLTYADGTIVTNNLCENMGTGVNIQSTNLANVVNNTLNNNDVGVSCGGASYYNTIAYNNCSLGGWAGIYFTGESNNLLWKNVCNNNTGSGIYLSNLEYINTIANNTCSNNTDQGIYSYRSEWTIIANNTCEDNSIGFLLDDQTYNNSVYWNLLIDNTANGMDEGDDNQITNNYWSDYAGVDTAPVDGIGDTPHPILGAANNEDPYPLMSTHFVPTLTSWVTTPADQYVEYNNGFYLDLDTSGPTPLVMWINDTTRFSIDTNWVITNTTPIDIGVYGLRVTARNMYGHHLVAEFNVIVQDTTAPDWISVPADIEIVDMKETFTFALNATDISGVMHYWISDYDNFSINEGNILTQWEDLPRGNYSLEVRAYDPYDNYASKEFILSVLDMDPPTINHPEDMHILSDEDGSILWYPYDEFPWKYEIYLDGGLYDSGTWTVSDNLVSVSLHDEAIGEYNYTIVVYDLDSNTVTDTVIVTVSQGEPPPPEPTDTTPPPPLPFDFTLIVVYGTLGVVVILIVVVVLRRRR